MKRNYYSKYPEANKTDLLTPAGIARLYRVTPACASNWITRYDTFPTPAVIDDSGTVAMWQREAVEAWHQQVLGENLKSLAKRRD